jgi:hypothetical protein
LSVACLPNAALRLEPIRSGLGKEGSVPADEGLFIFADLKPGAYRVVASLDGYKPSEQTVKVSANKNTGVTLDLEPILYTVKITTTVSGGEVRYAPVEAYTQGGEKKYKTTGETRVIPIDSQSRTAVIQSLRKGTYGIDVKPAEAGYEDRRISITVPDETDKEVVNLDVALKNVKSTTTFSDMTLDQWNLPAGWSIKSYILSANGKGIGIPRNEQYRHYSDFEVISDVKMVNGIGVSFVLRASDALDNFYLVRITGAKAEEPFLLSSYVIKNGLRERLQSVPIAHLSATLQANQFFKISIKMNDNKIAVSVADSQTGQFFSLGSWVDPNRRFSIGGVGIAIDAKEQNQFGSFIVCTPTCPTQ